ncbi:MAG: diguanylate cyclase [Desulfovibrionaceae bacterium]
MQTDVRDTETMWGLGLTRDEERQIRQGVGSSFTLRNMPDIWTPETEAGRPGEPPHAAWIPWRVWKTLPEERRQHFRALENTQRILIQADDEPQVEIEQVLEEGFLTVVRQPLSRTKVRDALLRAREVGTLYADIFRMTQEIFLEREMLSRKTDQLLFLNRLLTGAASTLEPAAILQRAGRELSLLLPVHLVMAAFWTDDPGRAPTDPRDADLYLPRLAEPADEAWRDFLLNQAADLAHGPTGTYTRHVIDESEAPSALTPSDGRCVVLPLTVGERAFGCLALLCDPDTRLAKDQVQTLKAAVSHLALALNNAMRFTRVKIQADHDALTRMPNRRALDERLAHELRRARRYGNSLSVLMLDLDHFKDINDHYGHAMGDTVLSEVAGILTRNLRTTDFAARYGGEEFVVLLPHTGPDDAHMLAERIRERIEGRRFRHREQAFTVTASIGVSSMAPGTLSGEADLLGQADQALYRAKGGGRNQVARAESAPVAAPGTPGGPEQRRAL